MNRSFKAVITGIILLAVVFFMFVFLSRHKRPVPVEIKARIAIVLDDWGYYSSTLPMLYEIGRPVTLAVLPNLKYSEWVAVDAVKNGYQTILHLPLESQSNKWAEKDTIYCAMDKDLQREKLKLLLNSVPGVSGVNNHQGSKGTEDRVLMTMVMSELKKKKMFYLDSVTTHRSVCPQVAKVVGIRFARRDVFLDIPQPALEGERLRAYIKQQLDKLYAQALKKGYAIGIGHDRKMTLSVLKEMMPYMEKKGVKFVFISELAR